jgi:hypothetical protein
MSKSCTLPDCYPVSTDNFQNTNVEVTFYSVDSNDNELEPVSLPYGEYDNNSLMAAGISTIGIYRVDIPLNSNITVTLYSQDNFEGENIVLKNTTSDLGPLQSNTSSIVIESPSEYNMLDVDTTKQESSNMGSTNQMMDANNQMMGATNQMMDANNQMMGANNQMMGANNQMMGANNQMMGATNQITRPIRTISSTVPNLIAPNVVTPNVIAPSLLAVGQKNEKMNISFDDFINNNFPDQWIMGINNAKLIMYVSILSLLAIIIMR